MKDEWKIKIIIAIICTAWIILGICLYRVWYYFIMDTELPDWMKWMLLRG